MLASYPPGKEIEQRAREIGVDLFARSRQYHPSMRERSQDWLMVQLSRDPALQSRALRFVDALAALEFDTGGRYVSQLFREYFGYPFPRSPRLLRLALHFAASGAVPGPLLALMARMSTRVIASRFITGTSKVEIGHTLEYLERQGRLPSFDILGEQVLSEAEAAVYEDCYHRLIEVLGRHPWAGTFTRAGVPRLQVSIKLSALTDKFNPVSPGGTLDRVAGPLSRIAGECIAKGIGLTVDAEEYEYRELSWHIFSQVFGEGRLGSWNGAGFVVQAYLRDAAVFLGEVLRFAESRQAPIQLRLVKGAYWDYETITAAQKGWPSPVFVDKAETDATYEELLGVSLGKAGCIRLAAGSHNIRSHAVAEAFREHLALPQGAVEHQVLYRTAENISSGMTRMGWDVRDYVPAGELVPGMAYMVRRVLENASQAGFLLKSRLGEDVDVLLRPPAPASIPSAIPEGGDASVTPPLHQNDKRSFRNSPPARLFLSEEREPFLHALEQARGRFGLEYLLEFGTGRNESREIKLSRNPSHPDSTPVGNVHMAGEAEALQAISVAREGFQEWSSSRASERSRILRSAASILFSRRLEMAAWVVHEGGRTLPEAAADVDEAVDHISYAAWLLERNLELIENNYRPRGVVAVIPPWNFPTALPIAMTAAALAAGNSVILKSAEQTPVIAAHLVRLMHEAGVPKAALVHLPGSGETAGKVLVESQGVDMVAFTGSKLVGKALYRAASRVKLRGSVKKVIAEMGGKNPIVVFADADIDEAVRGTLLSAFEHSNQKCSACSRVFVHQAIYSRFRDRLKSAAMSLTVGSAEDPDTIMNPLIEVEARDRVLEYARLARSEGNVLVDRIQEKGHGPFELGPLVVEIDASRHAVSPITQEEIFGPVLAIMSFQDEDEVLAMANGTSFALTAGLFSRSPARITTMVDGIRAGNIYVNRKITGARVGVEPFGGFQLSGTGPKAGGPDCLFAYLARRPGYRVSIAGRPVETALQGPVAEVLKQWPAPPQHRLAVCSRAAALLRALRDASVAPATSEQVADVVSSVLGAADELLQKQATLAIPGQTNYLDWTMPRGVGFVATQTGSSPGSMAAMVFAPLLAGNGIALAPDDDLVPLARNMTHALHEAGVPKASLRLLEQGGPGVALSLAEEKFHFAVTDMGLSETQAVNERLAATDEAHGQTWLKALISMPDSLQPGEPGFLRSFALPRTVAIRTLRHGADLKL
ncbi:MAG: proline dehydrogenase family protein [Chloroflexi bacterium]|nr:proline dehydrogenase family protein [Chloroflexota bacterium]